MRTKLASSKLGTIALVVAAGALIGSQIVNPAKRMIEAIGALLLVYLIWNFSTLSALWLIIILYPFPFAISVGNSSFVFIIVVFVIYIIRVSAHRSTFHSDRQFDLPILLMATSYLLSFYNVAATPELLGSALNYSESFLASIFLFYMVVNFLTDEQKLQATVRISMITCALVMTFTLLELLFPGKQLIPGWLYTYHKTQFIMKDIRMGGPFHDYELNAEFFAMNAPTILFLAIRARRLLTRSLFTLLLIADVVMLFTTVTRGALISLTIGLVYLAYLARRDLTFPRLVMIAASFVGLLFVTDVIVGHYTISGSLFGRMAKTTFESGIVPDTRVEAWAGALRRGMDHPFIGHGPGWLFSKGIGAEYWPHNVYLYYFNITGLFGLFTFIFLLVRLFQASFMGARSSLVRDSFPEAFMKVLNVSLVIFIIDQIKIDYLRSTIYVYFVAFFFGLIAATRKIILSTRAADKGPRA
jgi:hypothetical protein